MKNIINVNDVHCIKINCTKTKNCICVSCVDLYTNCSSIMNESKCGGEYRNCIYYENIEEFDWVDKIKYSEVFKTYKKVKDLI